MRAVVGEIRRVSEGRTKLPGALRESLRTQQAFIVRTSGKGSSPGSDSCYRLGKGLRPLRGPRETIAARAVGSQLTAFSASLLIFVFILAVIKSGTWRKLADIFGEIMIFLSFFNFFI